MSAVDLLEPILKGGLERNNFFNGRLLSAEDLRAEQQATATQIGRLARAIGDGIACGLGVIAIETGSERPVVRVGRGLALNRLGNLLSLADDADVALVPAATLPDAGSGLFAECEPPRPTASLQGEGAYVLVIAPSSGYSGTALVSDPNTTAAGRGSCGARFTVSGVRFRLVPMSLNDLDGIDAVLRARVVDLLPPVGSAERERLRNLIAHLCFGTQALGFADRLKKTAVKPVKASWGALDAMRARGDLTDCDVPLAIVVLTEDGLSFVDVWPARRKLVDAAAIGAWQGVAGPRRIAEAEAAFLQFQSQLEVVKAQASPSNIVASTYFDVLPAGGWLPTGSGGFDWRRFLGPHAPPAVTPVDAALLRGILERSWFDEAFALATDPPVPLRVYEVPEQQTGESFVVFARTLTGNIRVVLSPAPSANQTVEVTATAATGAATRATTRSGGTVPVPDLVPGLHQVTVTAPDYVAVVPRDATVVGGRTIDLGIGLTPLPNGSILVDAVDKGTGQSLGERVSSITAAGGGITRTGRFQSSGNWLIEDLPAANYVVTGVAAGYEIATKTMGPTVRGTQISDVLPFQRRVRQPKEPSRCVSLKESRQPPLRNVRLCLVLRATEFDEAYYYGTRQKALGASGNVTERFRIEQRARTMTGGKEQRYASETGEIVYSRAPWERSMVELEPLSAEIRKWLLEWREWFAEELNDRAILESSPIIYIQKDFRPSANIQQTPETPPGYAVFRRFAVPLLIKPEEGLTKAPVKVRKEDLPGIPDAVIRYLNDAEIVFIDDLAWSWREIVLDATGEDPDFVRYLIGDASTAIVNINQSRSYIEGMNADVKKDLEELGLLDDVAVANADLDKLTSKVGSRGFAIRLINQARNIAPKDSWSLESLQFSKEQVTTLHERGIDSKGAFTAAAGKVSGRAEIAEALGLDDEGVTTSDEAIAAIANDAVKTMAENSVAAAPEVSLTLWSKVDSMTASRLGAAGFATVDDLAAGDPAKIATAASVSRETADAMVAEAKGASRSGLAIGMVAPVTKAEEGRLRDLLGADATLGTLATKTADELAGAFGGSAERAAAVLNGVRAGLAGRGLR